MIYEYQYQQNGRRPPTWLFLAVGLGFLGLAVADPAPAMIWVILAAYLGLILWLIIANPIQGIQITRRHLIIAPEREARRIALRDIGHLAIDTSGDSTEFRLHLKGGRTVAIHAANVPSTPETMQVFEAHGIDVRVS